MKTDFATGRKPEADGLREEQCKAQLGGLARFQAAKVRNPRRLLSQIIPLLWISDLQALTNWAFLRTQNALTPAKPESERNRRASSVRQVVIASMSGTRRRVDTLNLYRGKASVTQNQVAKVEPVTRKSARSINGDE